MAGQLQDPVGTLGKGSSISPDLRWLPEAGVLAWEIPWTEELGRL